MMRVYTYFFGFWLAFSVFAATLYFLWRELWFFVYVTMAVISWDLFQKSVKEEVK